MDVALQYEQLPHGTPEQIAILKLLMKRSMRGLVQI
jgi:hypothetical protein